MAAIRRPLLSTAAAVATGHRPRRVLQCQHDEGSSSCSTDRSSRSSGSYRARRVDAR